MYGHDGASNNVAPDRHCGQLCAWKAWSETSREVDVGVDLWGEWHQE